MLVIDTAAANTDVTTVAAVKTKLGITGTAEDDYLASVIKQVTDDICAYLDIRRASDGTRTIGSETLVETFLAGRRHSYRNAHYHRCRRSLVLSRWPVTAVTSVVEDGVTLDTDEYQVSPMGILDRLCDDVVIGWPDTKIVVTYVAGWVMPAADVDDATVPPSLEGAAIDYISVMRSARTRDPLVKRENVPGVLETEYWVGQVGADGAMPPSVTSRLDRFRRPSIG